MLPFLLSGEHCLSLLRDTLLLQYRGSLPEMMTARQAALEPGDAVIARYSVDGFWHRATILEVNWSFVWRLSVVY